MSNMREKEGVLYKRKEKENKLENESNLNLHFHFIEKKSHSFWNQSIFKNIENTNLQNSQLVQKKKFRSMGKPHPSGDLLDKMNNFITNYEELIQIVEDDKRNSFNIHISKIVVENDGAFRIRLKDSPLKQFKKFREGEAVNDSFHLCELKFENLEKTANLISQVEKKNKTKKPSKEIKEFYEYSKDCVSAIQNITFPKNEELKDYLIDLPFRKELLQTKRIAIFDLDETLVHCEAKEIEKAQIKLSVTQENTQKMNVGINVRPLVLESLRQLTEDYIIIVFTASQQNYADSVLDHLDPDKNIFKLRLYRQNCIKVKLEEDFIYVKDLRIFRNLDLTRTVIIDNSILSFCTHLKNGIPILPFYDNYKDEELTYLVHYLKFLTTKADVREENVKNFDLENFLSGSPSGRSDSNISSMSHTSSCNNSSLDNSGNSLFSFFT